MLILNQLKPGVIYLTIGTSEQVRFLFPDLPLVHLIHPTPLEIQEVIDEKEFEQETLVIIRPYKNLVYPKTKKGTPDQLNYGVPTYAITDTKEKRRPLEPHPSAYYFICSDDLDRNNQKKFYRKLENGPAVALDLTSDSYNLAADNRVLTAILKQRENSTDKIPEADASKIIKENLSHPWTAIQRILDWPYKNVVEDETWLSSRFLNSLKPQPQPKRRQFRIQVFSAKEAKQYCLDHLVFEFEQADGRSVSERCSILLKALCSPKYQKFVRYKEWQDHFGPAQSVGLLLLPFLKLANTRYRKQPHIPINAFIRFTYLSNKRGEVIKSKWYNKIEYTNVNNIPITYERIKNYL